MEITYLVADICKLLEFIMFIFMFQFVWKKMTILKTIRHKVCEEYTIGHKVGGRNPIRMDQHDSSMNGGLNMACGPA